MSLQDHFTGPGRLEPLADIEMPPEKLSFSPGGIYYDGPSGKFLVDAGRYFRTYRSKSPVVTGLKRHFMAQGVDPKEAKEAAGESIRDAEVDRHVEWSGDLAGHVKGLIQSSDGKPLLVLTSPSLPDPIQGHAPVISSIINQAFPDDIQRNIFTGWLASGYKAVRAGIHQPAPMLCLAGKPNTGKSLLAYIAQLVLGGRSANPHTAWSGALGWNDDLVGAELLLLDDCQGSTDMRSRMNFASSFKEAIYSGSVTMKKRHCTSMSVRPVWRVMVCCNDNAESLLVLPPINSDTEDKIVLLRAEAITLPVDTSNPEGRETLQRIIKDELPALAHYLMKFELPEELAGDTRSGILAWRHPDLVQAIESLKPETRLEDLMRAAFAGHLWINLPEVLSASEIETRLLDVTCPVRDQVKQLFGTWQGAAGTYLGKLADGESEIVSPAEFDGHRKCRRFHVRRP
jgi:hypothetical protein